jgi:hypothetical protein
LKQISKQGLDPVDEAMDIAKGFLEDRTSIREKCRQQPRIQPGTQARLLGAIARDQFSRPVVSRVHAAITSL